MGFLIIQKATSIIAINATDNKRIETANHAKGSMQTRTYGQGQTTLRF